MQRTNGEPPSDGAGYWISDRNYLFNWMRVEPPDLSAADMMDSKIGIFEEVRVFPDPAAARRFAALVGLDEMKDRLLKEPAFF